MSEAWPPAWAYHAPGRMQLFVRSSNLKKNAPPGYLIVRVRIAAGLFVEAELNPFSDYEFRWFSVRAFDGEDLDCESRSTRVVFSFERCADDALGQAFATARQWFLHPRVDPEESVWLKPANRAIGDKSA